MVGSTPGDKTKVLSGELASVSIFKFSGGDGISVICALKKRFIWKDDAVNWPDTC